MSPLTELRTVFHDLMGWSGHELDPVDFVMSSYLSTFLTGAGEPSWADLVGGPGTGKGELLRSVSAYPRSVVVHGLTENAFASAYRDEDNPDDDKSLLRLLCESYHGEGLERGRKVLVIPELTPLLSGKRERVGKFFGDLRSSFDGEFNNQAGNLGSVKYKDLNFGFLAACTEILDEYRKINQSLGERTVVCRVARHLSGYKARRLLSEHVVTGDRHAKADLRKRIQAIVHTAFDRAIPFLEKGGSVECPRDLNLRMGHLANLGASVRTVPLSRHSLTTSPEAGTRLPQQLRSWGDCRVVFDGRKVWTLEDYNLVRRIVQDTMPPENLRLIRSLYRENPEAALTATGSVSLCSKAKVGLDIGTRQLKQWALIGVVNPYPNGEYALTPDVVDDIQETGFLEDLL